MNLKGHTKIELFNAETGELVQEVHEDNMITNAISDALNNCPVEFYLSSSINNVLNSILPIRTVGMGGVLVLGERLNENKTLTSLPTNVTVIGNAGGEYVGTNPYRGTYNSAESGEIPNGYRNVWDFPSNAANGDISCICLTSANGGNCGISEYDSVNRFISKNYGDLYLSEAYQRAVGLVSKGVYCILTTNGKSPNLSYYKIFNSDKIDLARGANNKFVLQESIDLSLENTSLSSSWTINSSGIIRYAVKDGTSIDVCKIDIINKKIILDKTISVSNLPEDIYSTNLTKVVACLDNYILATVRVLDTAPSYDSSNPYALIALDLNGSYVKTIKESCKNLSSLTSYYAHDKLLWLSIKGQWIDEELNIINRNSLNIPDYPIYSYIDLYPFLLCHYEADNDDRIYPRLDTTYLASINNLATTVTKTKELTMKITYDITEV